MSLTPEAAVIVLALVNPIVLVTLAAMTLRYDIRVSLTKRARRDREGTDDG